MRQRARTTNAWIQERAGLIVIVLALVMAGYLSWSSRQDRLETNCQTRYNQTVSEALRKRSQYSEQDRTSLVTFVREVSSASSPEASRDSLNKYLKTQDEIDRARKANPIPELNPEEC